VTGPLKIERFDDGSYALRRVDGRYLCRGRGASQRRSWSRETYRAARFATLDEVHDAIDEVQGVTRRST
jgi:hypothetical protein